MVILLRTLYCLSWMRGAHTSPYHDNIIKQFHWVLMKPNFGWIKKFESFYKTHKCFRTLGLFKPLVAGPPNAALHWRGPITLKQLSAVALLASTFELSCIMTLYCLKKASTRDVVSFSVMLRKYIIELVDSISRDGLDIPILHPQ